MLVITNAAAGSTDDATLRAARGVWDAAGVPVEAVETSRPDELDDVVAGHHGRRLVVVGGDGSVHAVVAALHRTGELETAEVAVIPLGTGNDFARGVALPRDPSAAARVAMSAHVVPMDLLEDDHGGVVVNTVNIGIGAAASERAAAFKPRLGALAYPLGAAIAGMRTTGWRLRITVDDVVLADGGDLVLHVVVANGAHFGGGARATPDAAPGDGRIDVMVSHATGAFDRIGYATHLARGEHTERRDVRTGHGTTVRIDGDEFPWNADGETGRPTGHLGWTLHRAAWSLAVESRP